MDWNLLSDVNSEVLAAALRGAMDDTRQARPEWAHTHYWGAFTLVGDWR